MLEAFCRVHTLAKSRERHGAHCGPEGLFVDCVALLDCEQGSGPHKRWTPRPLTEINRDLARAYGLPIDASTKMRAFELIAMALSDDDLTLACIGAVQMGLPEIPEHGAEALAKCAFALARIGMLEKPEQRFAKYSSDQPRDWRGRWTVEGESGPSHNIRVAMNLDPNVASDADPGILLAQSGGYPVDLLDHEARGVIPSRNMSANRKSLCCSVPRWRLRLVGSPRMIT